MNYFKSLQKNEHGLFWLFARAANAPDVVYITVHLLTKTITTGADNEVK
jgi:hypothetical protein